MSTENSHVQPTRPPLPRSSAPPFGRLWQVPTFLLGVTALLTVCSLRPLWSSNGGRTVERNLAAARQALEQTNPDVEQARSRAEKALADAGATLTQVGEAQFLLGSAYILRAEQATADLAATSWQHARSHLERAEKEGIADRDKAKLTYRLGKVYFWLNAEPQRAVDYLSRSVADCDDPFEGYALLARANLRLPKPDLKAALEATLKQLSLPHVNEQSLAQPRLLCGELYRRLDQPDKAREVLARIGAGAAPEVLFQARLQRASMLQEQGYWNDAVELWEQLRADDAPGKVKRGRICYYLGLCYRKLDKPAKAQRAWEEAQQFGGDEGQAAALGLAELRLRSAPPAAALEALETALKNVSSPLDYHNVFVELTETRALFEAGCRWYLQLGQHEAALQLARLYERLALPGVAHELGGQAAEGWGKALLEHAKQAASPDAARQDEEDARKKFREAGALFEAAAGATPGAAEQADWLWRSATGYLQGQDPTRALHVLERFVTLPVAPERLGEAWYVRGEAFRALRNHVAAQADYRHCVKFPGKFAYRARYQLAVAEIEQNNLGEAEVILTQNLELLESDATGGDAEAAEKSLFALANLLYMRRDFYQAYTRMNQALTRYPGNPNVLRTRLQLAQCARLFAEQFSEKMNDGISPETERAHYRKQRQTYLEIAASAFQKLADTIVAMQADRPLTAEEEVMARQAIYSAVECRFDLGQFDEVLRQCEELQLRYQHQVEQLIALRYIWQCQGVKFQQEQAKRTLDRIRSALKEMPEPAFDNASEIRSRRWWDVWLSEKIRPGA